ncbi:hypothetical protein AKJ16_DCAP17162 [Drosera capensis]
MKIKCTYFVSVEQKMQPMYCELGPDNPPYAAKFFDCCGAEDPDAPGCTTSFHVYHHLIFSDQKSELVSWLPWLETYNDSLRTPNLR